MKPIGRPRGSDNIIKKFTVAFTAGEYLAMNDRAVFEGCSMTDIIRRAVRVYLLVHKSHKKDERAESRII
jgi:hypothetical protein